MKKRTSNVSRRVVSLLMSMVLTLTLVTPAAFATEVVDGNGTTIVEGNANPADVNTNGDTEGKNDVDKNTEDGGDEQPANPSDEDKNPDEGDGDDANKPDEDKKDENEHSTEDENNGEDDISLLNAENGVDVWGGADAEDGIDTSWYTDAEKDTGTTADKPYEISTAAQLAGLAQLVNSGTNFSKKFIKLTADIKLNEQDVPTSENPWTPIGNSKKKFQGTFDGDGHTVSGLYIGLTDGWTASAGKLYQGLFGNVTGTVQNLIVTGSVAVKNTKNKDVKYIGGVVGYTSGTVQNCGFYGTISAKMVKSNAEVDCLNENGGIAGAANDQVKNCWFYPVEDCKAGVVGEKYNDDYTVSNCVMIKGTPNHNDVVDALNKDISSAGKSWAWADGDVYPTLITPPKTITLKPIFPDHTGISIKVNEQELDANGTYDVGEDTGTVTISLTGSDETFYYADKDGEKSYSTDENGNLTLLTNGYSGKFPITLFYGTKGDFDTLAVWNSALSSNGDTATIKNAATLNALARVVNSGRDSMEGKTITLGQGVTLSGEAWTPIGTEANPFKGTFNGNVLRNSGRNQTISAYTISNLNGDLFGVVDSGNNKTAIQYVIIDGGTGRLVGELKSGTVQYCMSTANKASGENVGGGLVGQNSGTVSCCYYYNDDSKNTPAVGGSGTVKNCFHLADGSTFGTESDTGARTADEFKLGRVTWELNGGTSSLGNAVYWSMGTDRPSLKIIGKDAASGRVYELTLTKIYAPEEVDLTLKKDEEGVTVFHNGNTWYAYCIGSSNTPPTVTVDESGIGEDNIVTYGTNGKPTKFQYITDAQYQTNNTYYYTINKKIEVDTSWYNETATTFTLSDTADLFGFANLVNGGKGFRDRTVELANDIDLAGYNWTPIGNTDSIVFAGTFNGNNHKITGMNIHASYGQYIGLFGYVTGTVQNVQVEGSIDVSNTSTLYVGGIVGCLDSSGEVRNCLAVINTEAAGQKRLYVGGVVGFNQGTVNLCWNRGSVQGIGSDVRTTWVGGVVGVGSVTNCANFGTVTGNGSTGGISDSGNVANSYNLGDVTGAEGKTYGISSRTVTNSYYICKLNGTKAMAYVNDADTKNITYNDADKTYTVGEDAALLVDTLNEKRNGNTPWFVDSAKGLYLPAHVLTWTGEKDDRFEGQTVTVTYDPNGGVNKDGTVDPINVTLTLTPDTSTGGFNAESYTILAADNEMLGFKLENGTFAVWKDKSNTEHAVGSTIQVSENITLYAQWDEIWVGSGTAADPYQIPDGEKLAALAEQVNEAGFDYAGEWFRLTNDIDLSNFTNWTPIGNGATISDPWFSGNLDGNGKSISGLVINSSNSVVGLFGRAKGGTFKGFKLNGIVTGSGYSGTAYVGSLIGHGTGVALDSIEADVTVTGGGYTGGLVGYADAYADKNFTAAHCITRGSVTGSQIVGGIAAKPSNNYPQINDCHNYATITSTGSGSRCSAAGIWACSTENAGGRFTGCTNNGTIKANSFAAGIATAGYATGCINYGSVTSTNRVAAGISNNGNAVKCGNTGTITGYGEPTTEAHGVAGITNFDKGASFCYNTGNVICTYNKNWAYGIAAGGAISNSFSYVTGKDIALAPNTLAEGKVINSYYLASKKDAVSSAGEYATLADFASGKVAWGVDGGTGAHKNYWTQDTQRGNNQLPAGPGRAYPKPIEDPNTEFSVYRALVQYGTGGTVSLEANSHSSENQENAVYGMKGTSVTVTATPKDDTFGLKSLTLDLMGTGSTTALESGDSFTLGEANALVVAAFASTGNGGNGGDNTGGNGGDGDGTGTDTGDGAGDENDEGLQDGLNLEVEYDVKSLILSAYGAWGAESSGKTFAQWLKDSPEVLRALITNSLDNMAVAAMGKKTDEAKDLAALLLASLNEHSGLDGQSSDTIGKMLRRYIESGTEAAFSAWLTTGGGMASGTYESIYAQYTNSLLALADRLYTNWESSGTSLTFPQWLDAQQVTMESLSENAEEPDTDTDDTQTTEAPEDVPDGQEAEGGASGGGNSVWEVIGTVVRENPILVWSIVAVIAALVIVGAVRRYHKVKRDERDDVTSKK